MASAKHDRYCELLRTACIGTMALAFSAVHLHAQDAAAPLPQNPAPTTTQLKGTATALPAPLPTTVPHSWNPFRAYMPSSVAPASIANSPRLETLTHDGKIELHLRDAIELALENNLDLAIARYNLPIAEADVMRTRAGGSTRGVNTGIVSNTPSGGSAGSGSSGGGGAGGTSAGAGGAGAGASGLVQSTLGTGTTVSSYDPMFAGDFNVHHFAEPLSNLLLNGVPILQSNTVAGDMSLQQAFATGTSVKVSFSGDRVATNSKGNFLNPQLDSYFRVLVQQQLLAGFGLGPNLRYLRIAKNNQKISDAAFRLQIIATVSQIENMYWDLVSAWQDERVKQESLDFAQKTLETGRQQLALQAIPAMDVLKDEAEVAKREQDLSIAKSTLEFQSLLLKNALTRNLDDPTLEAMPVVPMDVSRPLQPMPTGDELVTRALSSRLEMEEQNLDLSNRQISRKAANNALLPTVALTGYWAGTGLAGVNNPLAGVTPTVPSDYGGALRNAFNGSAPDYYVGVNVNIPIRNRVNKSDQYRSELEYRQAELLLQQLKKQIRIEVRNAEYALRQAEARVVSADKARDLARRTFDIMQQEQSFGAGSAVQTLAARNDLTTAESAYFAAVDAREKARVELERAGGMTLENNGISIESAKQGQAQLSATATVQTQTP
ncbi:TolC family protein [Terriglobus sp. TAA 43]|uniref:TolC family protein n=1 Tax=Terriglobus sp. TAA 43 TaxID=278961 RepID=UPI001E29D0CF|nr:TolC family protein [Terriglobus sp. TAA 43]